MTDFQNLTPAELLSRIDAGGGLAFVAEHRDELLAAGAYERCLALAFLSCRENFHTWPDAALQALFDAADRYRLRAAGQRLPYARGFVLYRGVSGLAAARRCLGYAWTTSLNRACWYAARFRKQHPAIYMAHVPAEDILCYENGRQGETFLVKPWDCHRYKIAPRRIHERAEEERQAMETRYGYWLDRLATASR